jgi:mono/diheme cytochrome c family protein
MLTKAIVFTSVLAVTSMATAPLARAAGQDAAAVQKGEALYGAQKCMVCHMIAGKGNKNNPLDKVGAKLSAADIREWIVNPVEMA